MRMWASGDHIKNASFGLYDRIVGGLLIQKLSKFTDVLHDHYLEQHQINLKDVVKNVKKISEYD